MKEMIAKAVKTFRSHPGVSYSEMVAHIATETGDADLAERLMEFVPIAYARVELADSGIVFLKDFCRALGNKKFTHRCPFSAEPVWDPAMAFAREEKSGGIPREDWLAVLAWSAEYNTYSKAVAAGQDMRGAVSATTFLRAAPMPCPAKAWWQFW